MLRREPSLVVESLPEPQQIAAVHFVGDGLSVTFSKTPLEPFEAGEPVVSVHHPFNNSLDVSFEPLRVRMGTPTITVNGVTVSPRSWEPDIELAARDTKVQAVLAFLAAEPTWHSLYAALDTVLKDRRTKGRAGVLRWGDISDARLQDFTNTANSFSAVRAEARHGPGYEARRPMTLEAGEDLVGRIVERWLDELRRVGA